MPGRAALAVLGVLLAAGTAAAQGIHSHVALPVAEGEGIWRSQLRLARAGDDPEHQGRSVREVLASQTLVIGLTPRLAGFATLPIRLERRIDLGPEGTRRDSALGDVTLLARYTFFADDPAPLATRRAAILTGIKLPSGADRFGTPTLDPTLGGVVTWAAERHELDADALFTLGTRRQGFEAGDALRYDAAYRYRIWPRTFGRRARALHGLVELNGRWSGRSREHGATLRDSGGHVLFLAPGLQWVTRRAILEASLQLPLLQSLNGAQVEADYVAVLSLRLAWTLF